MKKRCVRQSKLVEDIREFSDDPRVAEVLFSNVLESEENAQSGKIN